MIPESKQKAEKRQALVNNIEELIKFGYKNIELGALLNVHRNVISGLRIKKVAYPISLEKLDPLLIESEKILNKVKEEA